MKSILFFSNPFGYGPSGKALSIAKYIKDHTSKINITICGSEMFCSLAGSEFKTIKVDDRNEEAIVKLLKKFRGKVYVFSSQNRFAIKAAKKRYIKNAFLDGLSWFWREIPKDHFLADKILWIKYPNIKKKIPIKHLNKINLVSGIVQSLPKIKCPRKGITFYIGGCKNPLTPMPYTYLDLTANLLSLSIESNVKLQIVSDNESVKYLMRYPNLTKYIKTFTHTDFIKHISKIKTLISNGGQTTSMEAHSMNTPVAYYLPINLTQYSLIKMILDKNPDYPVFAWENYFKIPSKLSSFSEKEALKYFENTAKSALKDKVKLSLMKHDFIEFLTKLKPFKVPNILNQIGHDGTKQIFKILNNDLKLT